jgi:two-component system cell cycle sensor histidine kinase/response regulator CckA
MVTDARLMLSRFLLRAPRMWRAVVVFALVVVALLLFWSLPEAISSAGIAAVLFAIALTIGIRRTPDVVAAPTVAVAPSVTDAAMDVFHGLPVPLLRFDSGGAVIAANAEARMILGLDPAPDAALPEPHLLFVDLGRPVREWLDDVLAGRAPEGTEVVGLHSGEGDRFVQLSLRRDGSGGMLAVLQDATALKRLEAQFVQSQKMQAIGQLAGGIAHDFNNLLTAISGHCDLLLLRHRADDLDHADLIQIRQNANRAAALVAQLLAFSRKQTLKPERIDLQDTLSDLTHLLNRLLGEKVGLEVIHAREQAAIRADRRQLEQVIMNLVVNARDAMPEGGVVQVETAVRVLMQDMPRDRAVVPAGRYAVIRVIDSGVGIPPDRIGKIFEPFYTTKRTGEGTGLGLSTVYGIVKQSGGYVFVRSELGQGTEFDLWFPLAGDRPPPKPQAPTRRPVRKTEGVVLLVEDEAPVRTFAARALRLRGHSVLEAASAEEALALLADTEIHVDIFVTDVVMPGLDGPAWVAQALRDRPGVRTVFISGYAEDSLSETQARIPHSVFLPKPFSLAELAETVQAQLDA